MGKKLTRINILTYIIDIKGLTKLFSIKNSCLVFFSYILALIILYSCGGGDKEIKKISEDSLAAKEAFKFAETLKKAYVENDLKRLEELTTRDSYMELISIIKPFDKANLTFTPTWVEISGSTINLTISWKGTWFIKDKTKEDKGIAIFVLEGKPFKLAKILRANPFSQPD